MSLMTVLINLLVYSDSIDNNQPLLRDLDYNRQLKGLNTTNSFSKRLLLQPGASEIVVNTARSLSQDATTAYSVYLYSGNTFRFMFAGGTNPILRTKRSVAYSSVTDYIITKVGNVVRYTWGTTGVNPNFIVNGVTVGDWLLIEEGGNFNALNSGMYSIVTVAANYIEIINPDGVTEGPIALGTVIGGLYSPFQIFANDGVEDGDDIQISSTAFSIENRGVYQITRSTAEYFEVMNGNPGIPEGPITIGSATGLVFYPSIYSWIYVESDRNVSLRLNADTSNNTVITPYVEGDPDKVGLVLMRVEAWAVKLVNVDSVAANIKVFLSE